MDSIGYRVRSVWAQCLVNDQREMAAGARRQHRKGTGEVPEECLVGLAIWAGSRADRGHKWTIFLQSALLGKYGSMLPLGSWGLASRHARKRT